MAYTNVSTSKFRAKLGSTLNESAATSTPLHNSSSFSHKQLLAMGWTPGEGLGKRRDGMKKHVSVKKRDDGMGLGMEGEERKRRENGEEWWRDGLGDTLARLSNSKKSKKDKRKKEEDARKRFTDEELFQATGGARFGMRAQVRAEAKWARTESSLSNEEEEQVKKQLEWNGVGNAKIFLKDTNSKDVQDDLAVIVTEEEEQDSTDDSKLLKKDKKDKKKKSKKRSLDDNHGETTIDNTRTNKRRKALPSDDGTKEEKKKKKKEKKKKKDKKKKQQKN